MNDSEPTDEEEKTVAAPLPGDDVHRHGAGVRIWHWINALSLVVLLMSGLSIFHAHPRLYWGEYGANYDAAWLEYVEIGSRDGEWVLNGRSLAPAHFLEPVEHGPFATARPFPSWATLPSYYSLSDGRAWHLLFAWPFAIGLLVFLIACRGHVRERLFLSRRDVDARHIWAEVKDHARLRFPTGAAALDYNSLQRWSYSLVVLVLLPVQIFTGLTMAPGMDAAWPWLLDIFGSRQSARSIHFICAALLVLFLIVHVAMVLLAGPKQEIRAMITGRYRLPGDAETKDEAS